MKKTVIFFAMVATSVNYSIAQQNNQNNAAWQAIGPDTVSTNREVKVNKNLQVNGQITANNAHISDSLVIGDSTFVQVSDVPGTIWGSSPFILTDHIRSTLGRIAFFNNFSLFRSNIALGVGLHNPQHKIHISHKQPISNAAPIGVVIGFTNTGGFSGGTGDAVTDGFLAGILSNGDAQLNQQENRDMLFSTGAGALNAIRMVILGLAGPTQGFVGIGANFTNPLSVLHIDATLNNTGEVFRTNAPTGNNTFWRLQRNNVEMGNIFSRAVGGVAIERNNFSIQSSLNDITFHTQPLTGFIGQERMRIVGVNRFWNASPLFPVNAGNVGIGTANPLAMLHIGLNAFFGTGHRTWMNTGVLMYGSATGFDPTIGTDNMYVGLWQTAAASADAVINWGNNPIATAGPDRLRFIFTAAGGNGQASTFDGLETSRIIVSRIAPNTVRSFMGVGGDPFVNLYSAGTADPQTTLEINSPLFQALSPFASGLRFTDVNNTVPPPANPTNGVLSLNSSGDVIWVQDGGGGVTACPGALMSNHSGIQLNDFNFYFIDGPSGPPNNSVGIGTLCGQPLKAKLDVNNTTHSVAGNFVTTNGIGIVCNGQSTGTLVATGGYFQASGSTVQNIAVRARVSSTFSGIPAPVSDYAGLFQGDVWVSGINNGSGYVAVISDERLKTDTIRFTQGINIIRNLQPFTYKYNGAAGFETQKVHTGLIAEQVAQVVPFFIDTVYARLDTADTMATALLAIKSDALTFTALNAIKQLDSAISAPPSAPVLISPADGAVGSFGSGGATFIWSSVSPGIILYRAQLATDNSFSNIIIDQRGITDTTAAFGFCDTLPVTYYWRVSAKNNAGAGAWSNVFSFTDTAKCTGIGREPIVTQTGVGFNSASDSRLKTNVSPVTDALNKISQLNGVNYNWVQTPGYEFDTAQQIGLIAQDVQNVIPEVVHTDINGYLTLDYGRIVPVLAEAIKELKAWKDSVQNATARTNSLPNGEGKGGAFPSTDSELASPSAILWQNFPNPFGDGTVIRYFVPSTSTSALILFYDEFGNEIKSAELPYKGIKAELNLSTSNLASGIYSYSLIVNGRIADTKQMLKTK